MIEDRDEIKVSYYLKIGIVECLTLTSSPHAIELFCPSL